jgi:natural product biosynthesis luciferase-like monooxygenase protein
MHLLATNHIIIKKSDHNPPMYTDYSYSITQLLSQRARLQGDRDIFHFVNRAEQVIESHTYRSLEQKAIQIASVLQKLQLAGKPVLLLHPPGLAYLEAFFGCLYAGTIAVPVFPPRKNAHASRLRSIAEDSGASVALTSANEKEKIEAEFAGSTLLDRLSIIAPDEQTPAKELSAPSIAHHSLDAIAFLQYTSGSTGKPKGVEVSYRNLMVNIKTLQLGAQHNSESVFVSWLPAFHDMGLIYGLLAQIYFNSCGYWMSPTTFISKPLRWLRTLAKFGGTHTIAPNFAYDLCVQTITPDQLKGLDFSHVQFMGNAAEPIRNETVQQFLDLMAPFGLSPEALCGGYGLAEATLKVTISNSQQPIKVCHVDTDLLSQKIFSEAEKASSKTRTLVGCGETKLDTQVCIVNPTTLQVCNADEVGEIWIKGETIAQGYWQQPEATKATFQAYTSDTHEGPFLRTGDLGFVYDKELFVTGRIKDIIIIHGVNYYPHDIEFTAANAEEALYHRSGAAFSIEVEGREKLVVTHEINRNFYKESREQLTKRCDEAKEKIAQEHELEVFAVVMVKKSSIPKTSSGKIRRKATRQQFLEGQLEVLASSSFPPHYLQNKAIAQVLKQSNCYFASDIQEPEQMDFSLMYFSSSDAGFKADKYKLVTEGVKFADQHHFKAVWVPERHFHAFGGLFPSPAVLCSYLAGITHNIRLRAGSVVLPLHDPVHITESWALVDNLSQGRVDLAFARGWNANDFVLSPANYENNREILYQGIDEVYKLWEGQSITRKNGKGEPFTFKVYPQPVQSHLNSWITCSGGKERFEEAGARGENVLTALLFQTPEELGEKIAAYREARKANQLDPQKGIVTLMLHTFVGPDMEMVKANVKTPFKQYLKSSINLWKNRLGELANMENEEHLDRFLDYAFERYYREAALFGTVDSCQSMIDRLQKIGVNEIACLIDFGVEVNATLENLTYILQLKNKFNSSTSTVSPHKNAPSTEVLAESATPVYTAKKNTSPVVQKQERIQFSKEHIKQEVLYAVARLLDLAPEQLDSQLSFRQMGLNSIKAIQLTDKLSSSLHFEVVPTWMFEAPTIHRFAEKLFEMQGGEIAANEDDEADLADMSEEGIASLLYEEIHNNNTK